MGALSKWNLRNFKKGIKKVEDIARQSKRRLVDYKTGYAIAVFEQWRRQGKITRTQAKALKDLALETCDQTIADILEDESAEDIEN